MGQLFARPQVNDEPSDDSSQNTPETKHVNAQAEEQEGHIKTEEEIEWLLACFSSSKLMAPLADDQKRWLVDTMTRLEAPTGYEIIVQGDEDSAKCYAMESGAVDVFVWDQKVNTMRLGGFFFGKLGFAFGCARSATCIAAEPCVLWTLERGPFKQAMEQSEMQMVRTQCLDEESNTGVQLYSQVSDMDDGGEEFFVQEDGGPESLLLNIPDTHRTPELSSLPPPAQDSFFAQQSLEDGFKESDEHFIRAVLERAGYKQDFLDDSTNVQILSLGYMEEIMGNDMVGVPENISQVVHEVQA